ncbi:MULTISPECIES: Ig-like domain-containing protein [Brevibacillus]|uniref:BIG2 domain-containing protein n=1 Tax=Brevibacillus aydinogluensis TaxID=927786 RepID=A0AA48M5A2_9BACL|nr:MULTISPECIES: Ig-like domain-containing protein [Brevibacillus]CAJ1001537.1 BIG2 domain-containing protein [Brevibacillus aydinogluensis]
MRGRMKRFFVQLVVAAMLVTGVVPSVTPWETAYAEEMTPTQEVMHPGQSASAEQMPPSASESEVELVEMKPSHSKVTLKEGESTNVQITARWSDKTLHDVTKKVTWKSDNESVVKVKRGKLTGLSKGSAVVTVTYKGKDTNISVEVVANGEKEKYSEAVADEHQPESPVNEQEDQIQADESQGEEQVDAQPQREVRAVDKFEVTVEKGETVVFVNISPKYSYSITTNGSSSNNRTYDYAVYKSDGSVMNQDTDSTVTSKTVPAGGKLVVTVTGNPMVFKGSTEYFTYSTSMIPALFRKTLRKGETIAVLNTGGSSESILASGSSTQKYSYQVFKSDGSVYAEAFDSSAKTPIIPAGGKLVAEVTTSQPVTFAGYYEIFQVEETGGAVLVNETVSKGRTFVFVNQSGDSQKVNIDASKTDKRTYDFAIYNQDGTGNDFDKDASTTYKTVPAGGKFIVTVTSENPVNFQAFQSVFTGTESDKPALFERTVFKNQTISIVNSSTKSTAISAQGSSARRFSYELWKSDGTVSSRIFDTQATSVTIPAGGKMVATVTSDDPIMFFGYEEIFREEEPSDALLVKTLQPGESYVFVNKSDKIQKIDIDGATSSPSTRIYDYAKYKSDGTEQEQDSDAEASYKLVPAGGRLVVTVTADHPVTFKGFASAFEGYEIPFPALLKKTVSKNETIAIANTSADSASIMTTGSSRQKFSYQIWKSDGTLYRQNHDSAGTALTVPAGGKLVASVTTDEPVTFAGYYELFREETAETILLTKTLSKGQSHVFVNKSVDIQEVAMDASSSSARTFDYAIYNADGDGYAQQRDATGSSKTVPAGGKLVVTVTSEDPVTFNAFRSWFEEQDSKQPALFKQSIYPGETYAFVNTSQWTSSVDIEGTGRKVSYRLYDQNGALIRENTDSVANTLSTPAQGKLVVTVTGDSPVVVSGYHEHFMVQAGEGSSLSFTDIAVDSFADVNKGQGEAAYFKFTTGKTGLYRLFTSPYQGNGAEADTILRLYADPLLQNEIALNDNHDGPYGKLFSKVEAILQGNTTYFVKVEPGANSVAVTTRLTVEADLDHSRETATPAEWDEIYTDRLSSPYDVDYFKLALDELADMNLYVTANVLILEDKDGNPLKTFYANQEDTLFIPEETGTYYAKVIWDNGSPDERSARVTKRAVPEIGGGYRAGFHHVERVSKYGVVDSTPGFQKSVTLRWRFYEGHPQAVIKVKRSGSNLVVYEEIRTNLPAKTYLYFTWDGRVNQPNAGSYAENGMYKVEIIATDAPAYPIHSWISVRNTTDPEEYDLQVLIDQYNRTIQAEKIKRMQEYLIKMQFYDGPVSGQYNEEFLHSVIAYEATLNKWSTHVARDVYERGLGYLNERGEVTDRLLGYAYVDVSLGRDKYNSLTELFLAGDQEIFTVLWEARKGPLVASMAFFKKGGKITKEAVKLINETPKVNIPFKDIIFNNNQLGTKWGKHRFDYPELNNYEEYKNFANDIFKVHDKVVRDEKAGEIYFIRGNNLLRVKENGEFVSLYPGAFSDRVLRLLD